MGKVNIFKYNRIVVLDTDKVKINAEAMYQGRICGSAVQRQKAPKRTKYRLKEFLYGSQLPQLHEIRFPGDKSNPFLNCYKEFKAVKEVNEHLPGDMFDLLYRPVKKWETVWKLQKPKYFSWHNPPAMLTDFIEPVFTAKKTKVPFEQRPVKDFSRITANKIATKLGVWYLNEWYRNGCNSEKVNFKFITFTVTQPNFSHELTVKAWQNFLNNMKKYKGADFQYLWVAELQSGKRSLEEAEKCRKLIAQGINVEKNKEYYAKFLQAGLNPTKNIHYHLIVDRFYNIDFLNDLWLTCLGNVGAITRSTSVMTPTRKCSYCKNCTDGKKCTQPLDEFAKLRPVQLPKKKYRINSKGEKEFYEHHFSSESLIRYVAKYITKQSDTEGEGLRCAMWHCSRMVSKFATSKLDYINNVQQLAMAHLNPTPSSGVNQGSLHYVK